MDAEASKVISKSESVWPRFNRRLKQKSKNQSSEPAAFLNYAVEISPAYLISGESKELVRIVSISRDGEFVPVILSPVGKAISDEQQPTKKKKQLLFDAAKIKVKSRDAKNSVQSPKSEVCIEEDDRKKSDRRSWVRIAKAFRFLKSPAFHGNGQKVSQNPIRKSHAKETETPVIEQPKAQEIRQKKEVADSIPGPIEHLSKCSRNSAAVDCKSSKLWKFINFHRKVSSQASKRQGIKSATLSVPGMNSTTPNFQPKKINMSAERKGTSTGDATSEGEGYSMAINLSILIIIMACLVVFSNRLLAIVCTFLWWYLLPSLLEKNRLSAAAGGVNSGRSDVKPMRERKFKERPCDFNGATELFEYRKKDCGQRGFCRGVARPLQFLQNNLVPRFRMYKLVMSNRVSVSLNIVRRISHVGV